jgi:hypothetical protein
MNRLRARIASSVLAILSGAVADQSFAREPGDLGPYLRGVTIGNPGAAPPPGLYFQNTTAFAPQLQGYGQSRGLKVDAVGDFATLIWSTGWSFLGADVVMFLSQPLFNLTVWNSGTSGPPFAGATFYPTVHNTWMSPLALYWNLGNGWFAGTGFSFYGPDGSMYNNTANPDYWTYEPYASVSYLANGWNLTANFVYDFNTASAGHTGPFAGTPVAAFGVGYRSGDQASVDLTATKKFGNWEIGPVAYFTGQTTPDNPGGGSSCATMAAATGSSLTCGRATDFAIGGLIGYDFGPTALKLFLTDSVYTSDTVGGFTVWTKLSFRLWGPEAQSPATKPLIHK